MFRGLKPSEMLRREADNGAGAGGGMPAATKPGASPAGEAGATGGQQPADGGTGAAPKTGGMSVEEALAELEKAKKQLKDANAESAGRRKRLDELEAAEEARRQAQMSDAEKAVAAQKKLQEQLATYEAQLAEYRAGVVRYEVMLKAQELGLIDLDAAVKLLDMESLEYDEATGKPTNVEKVLKSLITAKPYLVKQDAKSPGLGTPPQKVAKPAPGVGEKPVRRVTPL